MKKYHYASPYFISSTKKCAIYNAEEDDLIGTYQRFYFTKFQFLIDFIVDRFYINIKVCDRASKVRAMSAQKSSWMRNAWTITTDEQAIDLISKTKIRTHPRYEFSFNGSLFKVEKNFGEKVITIKDDQNNQVIAELVFHLLPRRQMSVRLYRPVLTIYLAACIFQTVYIGR